MEKNKVSQVVLHIKVPEEWTNFLERTNRKK